MLKQQTYSSGKKKNRENKMVSVRFSCLLIALSLTVCHSIARPHQGQDETRRVGQKIYGEGEKISYQGSSENTVQARYKDKRGRNLMQNYYNNRTEEEVELKETDSNGENDRKLSNLASIRILGGINGLKSKNSKRSNSSNSKHHPMKKKSLKKKHSHHQRVKSLVPEELDTDSSSNGFVAFSADYGHPRHHPPKNN